MSSTATTTPAPDLKPSQFKAALTFPALDPVFEQLKALCLPHMTDYHDDLLVHDRVHLAKWPGVPFLHWTRSSGADLTMLYPHDCPAWPAEGVIVPYIFGTANREHILEQNKGMGRYHRDRSIQEVTHYYNGKTLFPVTLQRAVDIIEDYARGVAFAWRGTRTARYDEITRR